MPLQKRDRMWCSVGCGAEFCTFSHTFNWYHRIQNITDFSIWLYYISYFIKINFTFFIHMLPFCILRKSTLFRKTEKQGGSKDERRKKFMEKSDRSMCVCRCRDHRHRSSDGGQGV